MKQRAVKIARNKDVTKPVRTPPFDPSRIKPHKHGTGFSSCAPCASGGNATTCAHVADWAEES